mgnify:CR=1 FL=1
MGQQASSFQVSSTCRFGRIYGILTAEEIKRVEDNVDSIDKCWLNRSMCNPRVPFWTLGAVTYLEGCDNITQYHRHRKALNPVLKKTFSWFYDIVERRMSEELGDLVVFDDNLALPGFHIFGPKKGVTMTAQECHMLEQPLASIHTDIQYKEHMSYWNTFKEVDLKDVLSFTMAIRLPSNGGGLYIWDWADFDQEMIDTFNFQHNDDKVSVLKNKYLWENGSTNGYDPQEEPLYEEYTEGDMSYFIGHLVHQIAPAKTCLPTDRRITLQGHGVKCDGTWRIYF